MLNILMAIGVAVGLCCVGMVHSAQAFSVDVDTALKTEKDIYLATQRKSGAWGKAAAVPTNYCHLGSQFNSRP